MPRSGPAVEIERRSRWLPRHTPMPLLWWHTALTGTRARSLTRRRGEELAKHSDATRTGHMEACGARDEGTAPDDAAVAAVPGIATGRAGDMPTGTAARGLDPVTPPPLLSATGIWKAFRRKTKTVLRDTGLEVRAGEVVALVGENGAGKTTLLRVCAGLLPPDAGQVLAAGRIGYCPQEPGMFDLLTADEHLILFGRAVGLSRRAAVAQGRELLRGFGLPGEIREVARELSGGARQKLNVALALLGDPPILLLDEPYQGFDRGAYVNFWDHVQTWRDEGRGVVVVTHLLAELDRVDRVVELSIPDVSPASSPRFPSASHAKAAPDPEANPGSESESESEGMS
jgi:ABC-2 type transport system ATP-binding protein